MGSTCSLAQELYIKYKIKLSLHNVRQDEVTDRRITEYSLVNSSTEKYCKTS